jgi:hypothetical protein
VSNFGNSSYFSRENSPATRRDAEAQLTLSSFRQQMEVTRKQARVALSLGKVPHNWMSGRRDDLDDMAAFIRFSLSFRYAIYEWEPGNLSAQ